MNIIKAKDGFYLVKVGESDENKRFAKEIILGKYSTPDMYEEVSSEERDRVLELQRKK